MLSKEIQLLPSIEHFDMIILDCEDLKNGLSGAALQQAQKLLDKIAVDHHKENLRSLNITEIGWMNGLVDRWLAGCMDGRMAGWLHG